MTKEQAVSLIWDYMNMNHTLKKADVIFLLGSNDVRIAYCAAKLFCEGWAPYLAISGDGTQHKTALLKDTHGGKKEADIFGEITIANGVPKENLIIENTANNSQENFERMAPLIVEKGIELNTVILVQKPYMERRAFATGKVCWPDTELIVTSPEVTFAEYVKDCFDPDLIINIMVDDLERIREYPKKGFQIEQNIPNEVWNAFEHLVSLGYTKRLIQK